jgi:hypothetical protein
MVFLFKAEVPFDPLMIFGLFSDRFGLFEVFKILNEPLNLHGVDDGGREDISVFLTFVYID